ncbi:MAG TPA: hypothetical protein GX706_04345 [Candidatus Moranbacteria bacterium]|nr:hypothetical protein [Candidatus Moranbacteria bacterium]
MFWVALAMIAIAFIQVPSLVNMKKWPELAGFSIVWFVAALYALLIASGIQLPNPTDLLRSFYSWLYPLIGINFNL